MARLKRLGVISFGKFFGLMGFTNGIFTVIGYFLFEQTANKVWAEKTNEITQQYLQQAGQFGTSIALPHFPEKILPSLSVMGVFGVLATSTILGFLLGVMIAANYNGAVKLMGGLEVEVE